MTSRHAATPWPASSRNKACRLVLSRLLSRNCCTTDDTQILLFRMARDNTPRRPRWRWRGGGEGLQARWQGKDRPRAVMRVPRIDLVKIKRLGPRLKRGTFSLPPFLPPSLSFSFSTLTLPFPTLGILALPPPCNFRFNPRKSQTLSFGEEKGSRADQSCANCMESIFFFS